MRRRLLGALLALAVIATSISIDRALAGAPSRIDVQVLDDFFLPSLSAVERGGTVVWDFTEAERSHTVTDGSGMGLYDSGIVSPGGPSFSYRFHAAGRYPYVCTIHALMTGRVGVPVRIQPASARLGRAFRVRWATAFAEDGFVYDVQLKPPRGAWTTWLTGVTAATGDFEPRHRGTFRFRARLRSETGGSSEWSRRASLTAT